MKNAISLGLLTLGLCTLAANANALIPVNTVPEPSSLGLLSLALVIVALVGRKK